MRNLKVSIKLIISFLIMIILTVAVGIVGFTGMNSIQISAHEVYENDLVPISALGNLREIWGVQRSDIRNVFLSRDDPAKVQSLIEGIRASDRKAAENFELYESRITDTEMEKDYFSAKSAWVGPFAEMKDKMWALVDSGDIDGAYAFFTDPAYAQACIIPITMGYANSAAKNELSAANSNEEVTSLFNRLLLILIIVVLIAIVTALILVAYVSRLIGPPLVEIADLMTRASTTGNLTLSESEAVKIKEWSMARDEVGQSIGASAAFIERVSDVGHALERVAKGDLTAELPLLSDKDVMGISLNTMVDSLHHMFGKIDTSAYQVNKGSKQLSDGAQSLALGSTEQAASIEELSSSIAELAAMTRTNAEMADQAAKLASDVMGSAEKSSQQMDAMMVAANEINEASKSISKVIKTIDDIAFQTNILALNAAVEAARAGDHGKGFAVVAEEVRNLASKSAEAAKDTEGLIANSMTKAELGSRIADETASSLTEIVTGITESSKLISEIARSSGRQSKDIEQLNNGIEQVANIVMQNSATAQESAAAAEQMNSMAEILRQLTTKFRL